MMDNQQVIAFILFCVCLTTTNSADAYYKVHVLSEPKEIVVAEVDDPSDNLSVFCYEGENRNWLNIWKYVGIRLLLQNDNFEVFQGANESEVEYLYRQSSSLLHWMPWRTKFVDFYVYKKSCIGVYSGSTFSAVLEINYINFWKVLQFTCGLLLYFLAPHLSSNVVFYYSSGVVLGITASLLIIVYVISRFVPRRVGALSVLVGGWAVAVYVLQVFLSNVKVILTQHQSFVVTYLVVVGFVSFAVCYRYGTVDERTRNLIKWLLQGIGLLLIFLSTEWREVATSVILIVITVDKFPPKWKAKIKLFWRRRFPVKVKLLTDEEYHQQGADETRKALESLREFCNSPKCPSWKTMRKLNSPLRFAEFVEGGSHLSDDEILNYEIDESLSRGDGDLTDDDDDIDIEEENNDRYNHYATVI